MDLYKYTVTISDDDLHEVLGHGYSLEDDVLSIFLIDVDEEMKQFPIPVKVFNIWSYFSVELVDR